jgi:hypothetical protein
MPTKVNVLAMTRPAIGSQLLQWQIYLFIYFYFILRKNFILFLGVLFCFLFCFVWGAGAAIA